MKTRFAVAILFLLSFSHCAFAQSFVQKAVMIVPGQDFSDEELLFAKGSLELNRIKVTVACSSLAPARGVLGTVIRPDITLENVKIEDYDAIIFIGGKGAREFWDDAIAHSIAVKAQAQGRLLGAASFGLVTLARAGVLKQKRISVSPEILNELKASGAKYTRNSVEVDGNIISASNSHSARKFGEAIVIALVRRRLKKGSKNGNNPIIRHGF